MPQKKYIRCAPQKASAEPVPDQDKADIIKGDFFHIIVSFLLVIRPCAGCVSTAKNDEATENERSVKNHVPNSSDILLFLASTAFIVVGTP